jgi:hypothetical protein
MIIIFEWIIKFILLFAGWLGLFCFIHLWYLLIKEWNYFNILNRIIFIMTLPFVLALTILFFSGFFAILPNHI